MWPSEKWPSESQNFSVNWLATIFGIIENCSFPISDKSTHNIMRYRGSKFNSKQEKLHRESSTFDDNAVMVTVWCPSQIWIEYR